MLTLSTNTVKLSIPLCSVERFQTRENQGAADSAIRATSVFLCPKSALSLFRSLSFMVGGELERFLDTAFETSLLTHRPTFRTVAGGLSNLIKEKSS